MQAAQLAACIPAFSLAVLHSALQSACSQLAVNLQSTLGEGAIWDDKNKCLYWVDILKGLVHKYDLIKANHETKEIGGFVGSVVPVNQNEIVLLVNREFVRYNWSTGEKSILGNVEY